MGKSATHEGCTESIELFHPIIVFIYVSVGKKREHMNISQADFENFTRSFFAFREEVVSGFNNINKRLEVVDQRLEKIDQRVDKLDQRLDKLETRFRVLEQRMGLLEQRMGALEQSYGGFRSDFDAFRIETANSFLGVAEYFDQLNDRQYAFEIRLINLTERFDRFAPSSNN